MNPHNLKRKRLDPSNNHVRTVQWLSENVEEACATDIHQMVAHLQKHADDPTQLSMGCTVLSHLSFTNSAHVVANGALPLVILAAEQHTVHSEIQQKCCAVLANVTRGGIHCQRAVVDAGGVRILVSAMRGHLKVKKIQVNALLGLGKLVTKNVALLVDNGAIPATETAMREYPEDKHVHTEGCILLRSIAQARTEYALDVLAEGVVPIVISMTQHPTLFEPALVALASGLAPVSDSRLSACRRLVDAGGVPCIIGALSQQLGEPESQLKGGARLNNYLIVLECIALAGERCEEAILDADGVSVLLKAAQQLPGGECPRACYAKDGPMQPKLQEIISARERASREAREAREAREVAAAVLREKTEKRGGQREELVGLTSHAEETGKQSQKEGTRAEEAQESAKSRAEEAAAARKRAGEDEREALGEEVVEKEEEKGALHRAEVALTDEKAERRKVEQSLRASQAEVAALRDQVGQLEALVKRLGGVPAIVLP